jgi:hypothetical protein
MSKSDEYRRNADECRRMASRTQKPEDEAAWLRLAYSWLKMLQGEEAVRGDTRSPAEGAEKEAPAQKKTPHWPDADPNDNQSSH